jgi:glycosyltransferase involved in cell wall biosynthesis
MIESKPLVSVIMANYNNELYLSEAIESILNQTYKNFELIIIDDCSTDSSWDIIQKYAKKDKRIRIYRNEKNLGCTKTANLAIRKSVGIYIARMDSDDISSKKRFEFQVDLLENNKKIGICGTNLLLINKEGKFISKRKYEKFPRKITLIESPFAQPSVMFRRILFEKYGGYNENFDVAEDYELWFRFYSKKVGFYNIQKSLVKYRISDFTAKSLKTKALIRKTLEIKKYAKNKYKVSFGFSGNLRILLERTLLFLPSKLIIYLFILYVRFFKDEKK